MSASTGFYIDPHSKLTRALLKELAHMTIQDMEAVLADAKARNLAEQHRQEQHREGHWGARKLKKQTFYVARCFDCPYCHVGAVGDAFCAALGEESVISQSDLSGDYIHHDCPLPDADEDEDEGVN